MDIANHWNNELEQSIANGKINDVKLYIKDQTIKNHWCLHSLVEKKERPNLLLLLNQYNIDLTQGGNILFFKACLNKKIKNSTYLSTLIPNDDPALITTAINLINKYPKQIDEAHDFLHLTLAKINGDNFNEILKTQKNQNIISYISAIYMEHRIHYSNNPSKKTNKI